MRSFGTGLLVTLFALALMPARALPGSRRIHRAKVGSVAQVLTRDGKTVEGVVSTAALDVATDGKVRRIALRDVLSISFGGAASAFEQAEIASDLPIVSANTDRAAREQAVETLTAIGLPVMTPLLDTYRDTDMHQPYPLYRLFGRIVPGYADAADRSLDLVRLADGSALRGKVLPIDLQIEVGGVSSPLPLSEVRRFAMRRAAVTRTFDLQALYHCVQIEYLDSGVATTTGSKITETSQGAVRLSFGVDGWLSDPDGLKVPGPHYNTNLYDSFPYGAVLARIGAHGARFIAGSHFSAPTPAPGRLYFAVNDSPHWQNNIGSFRVKLRVTEAYDLGDPQ